MIFKCKICGGELNIERGQSIVECEYCGVKQTLPRFFDENVKLMYDRANNYLLHNEFDKAENIYNQILYTDKEDSDAYWSLVLCKYGIAYVRDLKTGKYIPTCNRTYYSSIFDDENYKNAIKYASEEKKALFEADAKTIDGIQHSIIAISRKEKPFDIFISYKETGANGGRTKDSIVAQDLYEKLTSEGYKVFFSRITLEDKIGTEYEPYIYAALASSKVMITVCSSKENIESVWVKNEWSRFMSFMQKDSAKTILPLYFDMDKSDLPDEFAHLPSHDMKTDGFEQDLLRGIKKLIPLPIMEKERREKRKKLLKKIGLGAVACLVVTALCMIPWFMKLPDYNAAMQLYYDKNYPEATWAFDELGSYRNSKAMKDKCEKSWRKSLATVIDDEYYVTPNGSIESVHSAGKLHNDININTHGKIVSISETNAYSLPEHTSYTALTALYSDGFCTAAYSEDVMENNYSDNIIDSVTGHYTYEHNEKSIIQAVSTSNSGVFLLNDDGNVTFHQLWNKIDSRSFEEVSSWRKIVKIRCFSNVSNDIVIGIKNDGTICYASNYYGDEEEYGANVIPEDVLRNLQNEKDVKDMSIEFSEGYLNYVNTTQHNTYRAYIDHNYYNSDTSDIIDARLNSCIDSIFSGKAVAIYTDKNGNLTAEGKVLLKDVVNISDKNLTEKYLVTRVGNAYSLGYDGNLSVENIGIKTVVYDEWIEEMD